MLLKSDQEFIATLNEAGKIDQKISSLQTVRFFGILVATLAATGFFVTFFICVKIQSDTNRFPAIPPILTLATFLQPAISSMMAHNQIRMLLLYKKLRDDKSVVTP